MAGLQSQSGRPKQERKGADRDERQRSFHLRPRRPHFSGIRELVSSPRNGHNRYEHGRMYVGSTCAR
jgi:hypothetical protein